jgi:hypothetical protein
MKRDLASDYRLLTSFLRLRPDFIIPGEAKCGTTSLYRYLTQHPDVAPAEVKEPRTFLDFGASPYLCRRHYPLSLVRWIGSLTGRRILTGEASAEYFSKSTVPGAVAAALPKVQIIVLLRNPVTRALSDYRMLRRSGHVAEPFETVARRCLAWLSDPDLAPLVRSASQLEHNPVRIIQRGLYLEPLRSWKERFPDLTVIRSEDLFRDPEGTMAGLYRHLGLAPFVPPDLRAYRRSEEADHPSESILREMADFFRPRNEELYRFLGRDLGWEDDTEKLIAKSGGEAGKG